jgi:hypothetical protein
MRAIVLENGILKEKEIENSLETMQEIVGGWIERAYMFERFIQERIDPIINEEGKLIGLEPQVAVLDRDGNRVLDLIMGNCVFVSHDDEGNTIGLTDRQINIIREELGREVFIPNMMLLVKAVLV